MNGTKIATCSYCGTKAALVLRGERRHELTCASCGAQLHDLKMLPKREETRPVPRAHTPVPGRSSHERAMSRSDHYGYRKPRKKNSFKRRLLSEIIDAIDDIFD